MNRVWPEAPAPWGGPGGYPPPPGGAAPGWIAPPPPRKRSLAWLWILLGLFAFVAVLGIATIVWFVNAVRAPVDGMNHYLAAVDHGAYDTAYDDLCRAEQNATPREQFPAAIAPFASRLSEYQVYSFDPVGNERTVQYRVTDLGGRETTYRATMVREGGAWRVCDFFNDTTGAS